MPKKTLADLRQKQQGVLNYHSHERTDIYWLISGFGGGQPPIQDRKQNVRRMQNLQQPYPLRFYGTS